MPIFNNVLAGAAGQGGAAGYKIERSLRFNDGDTPSLSRNVSSAGNRKKWTWSGWFKVGSTSQPGRLFSAGADATNRTNIFYYPRSNGLGIGFYSNVSGTLQGQAGSTAVLADHSAWYHLVFAFDAANSTTADRIKIYINGVQQTISYTTNVADVDHNINNNVAHYVGRGADGYSFDGYLADVHFVDGQALAATDFGEYDDNNVWQPKEFTGSYGWFDQSQTWSGLWSTTGTTYGSAAALHDATVSTSSYFQIDNSGTFTLPSALPVTSLRFFTQVYGSGSNVSVNGTDVTSQLQSSGIAWTEITGFTSLSTISVTGNQNGSDIIGWYAIELNGKLLIDSGITGIADNSFHLDFSDNSSDAALGTDSSGNSNDWTVNNLAAAAPTPVYSSTHGSNITSSELAKLLDGDDSTYATASGDLIGFSYSGNSITMKVGNTDTNNPELSFIIQPFVNNIQTQSGTWSNVSVGSVASNTNFWNIPGNSTGTGTFTFPATWDGNFRIYLGGWSSAFRMYSLDTAPAEGAGTDSLIDTPTNYEAGSGNNGGNYATLNPLLKPSGATLSNGNLEFTSSSNYQTGLSTIGMSSGKWYFEASISVFGTDAIIGIVSDLYFGPDYFPGSSSSPNSYGYEAAVPYLYPTNTSGYSTYTTGDIIGVAYDADNGKIYFAKNGVWGNSSDPVNGTNPGFTGITGGPHFFAVSAGTNGKWVTNFGQRPFAYTPPTGYVSLCTTNLTDPTIEDPSDYFDVALDTGANILSSTKALCNGNADFLWIKDRANTGTNHHLIDIVRDPQLDGTPFLASNSTSDETTLGTYSAPSGNSVGWAWDAGSSNTPISAGSLNSSFYNNSQTWSNQVTGTNYSNYPKTQAFNNNDADYCLAGDGQEMVFTPSPSFSNATTVKIWYYAPTLGINDAIKINGTGVANNVATSGTVATHTFTVSGFTSLSWSRGGSGSTQHDVGIARIDVDGVQLVDSGISMPSYPSIASTVRANPSAGFSIVKYTGDLTGAGNSTIAHGLNAAPGMVITKDIGNTSVWIIQHESLGADEYLRFDETAVSNSSSAGGGSLPKPDSNVFYGSYLQGLNASGNDYIAYCFAPVEGYSAFDSYTGNGSTSGDGSFVYTGFRPKWLLLRHSDDAYHWYLFDASRDTDNVVGTALIPNEDFYETSDPTTYGVDFLSNGFKLKNSNPRSNGDGVTYIYAAFAEHPFKTARAR